MLILFFLIIICTFFGQLLLPWWSMCLFTIPLAFIFGRNFRHVIWSGFFGCGMVWLVIALVINESKGNIMTSRIASLFSAPSNVWLFLGAFIIPALLGGLSASAGFSLRRLYKSDLHLRIKH